MDPTRKNLMAFVRKKRNGCWDWLRGKSSKGYGYAYLKGKGGQVGAHHLSFFLFYGHWPKRGVHVLHSCDNPGCVNPKHLFLGTNLDNIQDKVSKGRSRKGENHHKTKLTAAQIRAIRKDERTHSEIANDYGMSRIGILQIKNRRTWKHV